MMWPGDILPEMQEIKEYTGTEYVHTLEEFTKLHELQPGGVDLTPYYTNTFKYSAVTKFMSKPAAIFNNEQILARSVAVKEVSFEILNKFEYLYKISFMPSAYVEELDVNTFKGTGVFKWTEALYIIRGVLKV